MTLKQKKESKPKRKGYWKAYEKAGIKDCRLVWDFAREIVQKEGTPFEVSKRGRHPKLELWMYVCLAILYTYFDDPFREVEESLNILTGESLDHSNIVRWFGRLTPEYIDGLVYKVHEKIIEYNCEGDYLADGSGVTCDRYKEEIYRGEKRLKHETWKLHIFAQYLLVLGLVSIVSVWATHGDSNESPIFRNHLVKPERVKKDKLCHADKAYFAKENINKLKHAGLIPNLVPKEREYSDSLLKKAVQEYDNEARKKTRGLVETPFGGLTTEQGMKTRLRKTHHRNIHTTLMGLKHNIKTYLRAKALSIYLYFRTNLPYTTKFISTSPNNTVE